MNRKNRPVFYTDPDRYSPHPFICTSMSLRNLLHALAMNAGAIANANDYASMLLLDIAKLVSREKTIIDRK